MWCNQIFSLLEKTTDTVYTIRNIVVCEDYETASQIARTNYGDSAIAIDTTFYPVHIGTTYTDGIFYSGNVPVMKSRTEEVKIDELKTEIKELRDANKLLTDCLLEISEIVYA